MRHSQGIMCPQLLILQQCQEIVCSCERSHPCHCILLLWQGPSSAGPENPDKSRAPGWVQKSGHGNQAGNCRSTQQAQAGTRKGSEISLPAVPRKTDLASSSQWIRKYPKRNNRKILSSPCPSSSQVPSPARCCSISHRNGLGMEWLPQQGPCELRQPWQGCGWSWATAWHSSLQWHGSAGWREGNGTTAELSCAGHWGRTPGAQQQPQTALPAPQQHEWKCSWSPSSSCCLSCWPVQGQPGVTGTPDPRDVPCSLPGSSSTSSAPPQAVARGKEPGLCNLSIR